MNKADINEIYEKHFAKVFGTCMNYLKNEDDAADITQDTFITAANKLHSLKDPEKLEAWLCKIAANKCKDHLKKNKPLNFSDIDNEDNKIIDYKAFSDGETPEKAVITAESKEMINKIVTSLPNTQRTVIIGFYYDRMSVKELAKYCGCSANAIKVSLHRARKSIKNECEQQNVHLGGASVVGILSSMGPTAAMTLGAVGKASVGAVVTKIIAGVCAVALIGYGGWGIAHYSGDWDEPVVAESDGKYDPDKQIGDKPIKFSDVIAPTDPIDKTGEYTLKGLETLFGTASVEPLYFIDDNKLLVYRSNSYWIYDFSINEYTSIDADNESAEINELVALMLKNGRLQYISENKYYLCGIGTLLVENDQIISFDLISELINMKYSYEAYLINGSTDDNFRNLSINPSAKKAVLYLFSDPSKCVLVDYAKGTTTEIEGLNNIDSIVWLSDNVFQAVCCDLGNETVDYEEGSYIVQYHIDSGKIVKSKCNDAKDRLALSNSNNDYGDGYYSYSYNNDDDTATATYYNTKHIGILNSLTNKYYHINIENSTAISSRGANVFSIMPADSKSSYNKTLGGDKTSGSAKENLTRYNVNTKQYETVAAFVHGGGGTVIASPNGERMVLFVNEERNGSKRYLLTKNTAS